jgi:hypothetical protein
LTRRKLLAGGLTLAILGFGGWYTLGRRATPEGQAPLRELRPDSLEALKADFNGARDAIRVIVLLAPT